MANNRMWLKCTKCGERRLIAKYNPYEGWYFECISKAGHTMKVSSQGELEGALEQVEAGVSVFDYSREDNFNEIMDEHRHGVYDDIGPTHFVLEFESDQGG